MLTHVPLTNALQLFILFFDAIILWPVLNFGDDGVACSAEVITETEDYVRLLTKLLPVFSICPYSHLRTGPAVRYTYHNLVVLVFSTETSLANE